MYNNQLLNIENGNLSNSLVSKTKDNEPLNDKIKNLEQGLLMKQKTINNCIKRSNLF